MADTLGGIVDNDGKMVGKDAVGTLQNESAAFGGDIACNQALLAVGEDDAPGRHVESQGSGVIEVRTGAACARGTIV